MKNKSAFHLGFVCLVPLEQDHLSHTPRCKKARTRTTTLTLPPPSILASIGTVPSRDLSEGVEADEYTMRDSEAADGEGINLASRAIMYSVSLILRMLSSRRRRRMCHIKC